MKHEPFHLLKNNLLELSAWKQHGVHAHFTTRQQGNSTPPYDTNNLAYHVEDIPEHVTQNREILAQKLGIPLSSFVFGAQNHGINIAHVTKEHLGAGIYDFASGISETDALYTSLDNVVLATFYADCTPLYFHAPKHHLIGIAHSGWQGTVKGMMHAFLSHWIQDLHIAPEDIFVAIGPAISKSSYMVDETVAKQVKHFQHFDATSALTQMSPTHYKFDAQQMNYDMARHLNIPEANILTTSYCTYADDDLFFSFRRDGITGRMLATISQKEDI